MGRYIIRRLLHMVPTVFGVILITFVLFNIVGGSPAALMFGQNAAPKSMEEFDEERGFNKPLFWGNWTATRAFTDSDFDRHAGPWKERAGVTHHPASEPSSLGCIRLAAGSVHTIPLAFGLNANTDYKWIITYRLKDGGASLTINRTLAQTSSARATVEHLVLPLRKTASWQTIEKTVSTGPTPAALECSLRSDGGPLEISRIQLRRKTAHLFDSQLCFYFKKLAHCDFGVSSYTNLRVSRMLKDGILPSLLLTIPIFLGNLIVSVCMALLCAYARDRWLDRSMVVITVILMSVNYLVWIIAGQYLLAFKLDWFPIWGFESWSYLLLPILIGIFSGLGENVRFYRTIMLDEMNRDYVRTAAAKGVGTAGILFRHVLQNAMIPILTNVIVALPFLYTGSLLLEGFFGIPGLGSMSINAITYGDVDVIRAIVLMGAVLYVLANLLTDLCYALTDPRVRLS